MAGKKARKGERIRPCRRCKEPVKFIKSTWSVFGQRRQGWHWVNEDGAHHRCRDFNSSTGGTGVTTDEFFGGCPECGGNDALLHVGLGHWSVCREHQTRWDVGALHSFKPGQDEELWISNTKELIAYRVVDPILSGPKGNGVEDAARDGGEPMLGWL